MLEKTELWTFSMMDFMQKSFQKGIKRRNKVRKIFFTSSSEEFNIAKLHYFPPRVIEKIEKAKILDDFVSKIRM